MIHIDFEGGNPVSASVVGGNVPLVTVKCSPHLKVTVPCHVMLDHISWKIIAFFFFFRLVNSWSWNCSMQLLPITNLNRQQHPHRHQSYLQSPRQPHHRTHRRRTRSLVGTADVSNAQRCPGSIPSRRCISGSRYRGTVLGLIPSRVTMTLTRCREILQIGVNRHRHRVTHSTGE